MEQAGDGEIQVSQKKWDKWIGPIPIMIPTCVYIYTYIIYV